MGKSKFSVLKEGAILSETSFFVVKDITAKEVIVQDENGNNNITLSKKYVDQILKSADFYEKEEKLPKTELAALFLKSTNMALTVCYVKKAEDKTKKAFEAEKQARLAEIKSAKGAALNKLIENLVENPVLSFIPGETRVMIGRHYGNLDDTQRVKFVDMEAGPAPLPGEVDKRMRLVDPRTILYIIADGVKYSLK